MWSAFKIIGGKKRIPLHFALPGLLLTRSYYERDHVKVGLGERLPFIADRRADIWPALKPFTIFSTKHMYMIERSDGVDQAVIPALPPPPKRRRRSEDIWPELNCFVRGITTVSHQELAVLPSCWVCRGGNDRTVKIGERKIPYKEKRCCEIMPGGAQRNAMLKFLQPRTGDKEYFISQHIPPHAVWKSEQAV